MKILLVEDDPGIIHSLTEFLTGEGFTITSVPGQQEAVRQVSLLTKIPEYQRNPEEHNT